MRPRWDADDVLLVLVVIIAIAQTLAAAGAIISAIITMAATP